MEYFEIRHRRITDTVDPILMKFVLEATDHILVYIPRYDVTSRMDSRRLPVYSILKSRRHLPERIQRRSTCF